MPERTVVIEAGKKYYAGGTVPKTARHGGVTDIPMMASEYAPNTKSAEVERIYRGGTTTSQLLIDPDENIDDMGRELIR